MIKAVIFDLFGVIITDAFDITYEKFGGNPAADRAFIVETMTASNNGWITSDESRRRISERLGIAPEEWLQAISSGEARNTQLLEWIETLRGSYKTALLSNVAAGSLYRRFGEDELRKFFDIWVASGDVGFAKPAPEIYHYTAHQLGVQESECVLFDDRTDYVAGAAYVGMHAFQYTSFEAARATFENLIANQPTEAPSRT